MLRGRLRLALIGLILVIAFLFWWRHHADARQLAQIKKMQKELFSTSDEGSADERRQKWQKFREAMDKLTPEQRGKLRSEGRARRDRDLLRYAAATKEERARILDDNIRRVEEWRQRRQDRERRGDQVGRVAQRGAEASKGPGRGNQGRGSSPRTSEARLEGMKKRLDNSTPEVRAARDLYSKDLQARRTQLGLAAR